MIQTIDSKKVAENLDVAVGKLEKNKKLNVLIQVNTSAESGKKQKSFEIVVSVIFFKKNFLRSEVSFYLSRQVISIFIVEKHGILPNEACNFYTNVSENCKNLAVDGK